MFANLSALISGLGALATVVSKLLEQFAAAIRRYNIKKDEKDRIDTYNADVDGLLNTKDVHPTAEVSDSDNK